MRYAKALLALSMLAGVSTGAGAQGRSVTLPVATDIPLETTIELTSKNVLKSDRVMLRTSADVIKDGVTVIPKGTEAIAEIARARKKGWFGQRGRLALRPLYLQVRGQTVRLRGRTDATGKLEAGGAVGLAFISPIFTGTTARIAPGSRVEAEVERDVTVTVPAP